MLTNSGFPQSTTAIVAIFLLVFRAIHRYVASVSETDRLLEADGLIRIGTEKVVLIEVKRKMDSGDIATHQDRIAKFKKEQPDLNLRNMEVIGAVGCAKWNDPKARQDARVAGFYLVELNGGRFTVVDN